MIEYDSDSIGKATPISNWVKAMEQALRDTMRGEIYVPQRSHIEYAGNTLLLMPCFGKDFFSTKLVTVFPENLKRKKPTIYGTVVLNDGSTGEPLAVFDGGKLTAMRTAAVGSLGIKYLSDPGAQSIGVIGLGIQGFHQALFACSQRPVKILNIYDRSPLVAGRFRERFNAFYPDVEVVKCKNATKLCENSEIIITATGSKKPVIPEQKSCWEGKTLIGIGSYKPDMREFPNPVFQALSQVFVDTLHGLTETGDLLEPLSDGLIEKANILSIGELIEGKIEPEGKTRLFKSVGMAAFDLYGAMLVYNR